ncbi:enhancer of rudimentary protein [Klebsormidium nitens]|uniref:Enhancer of rudimentary protein n=1 Tax=Klebsormidium nitens TaxID=105231 RepID=A0A1Y1I067_KLENI|nr:enhancer of rudimentary protein [Klebsormidium nitens]|eukprot:GAQ82561.1 enhancer of rudimentary protein [Klebsormidium nitens]
MGSSSNGHTIMLYQLQKAQGSRTWESHDTISAAMDALCARFEKLLKERSPNVRNITYDVSDLFGYIDSLYDISALVLDEELSAYIPCDRKWIQNKALQHLKQMAAPRGR